MSAESLFFLGNDYISLSRWEDAERCFRQAIEASSEFAEGHANLAYVLDRQGDPADAEKHYRLALACDNSIVEVHINLGVLIAGQKRFDEAESEYRLALSLASERGDAAAGARAWSCLGVLQAGRRQDASSEASFRRALALNAGDSSARFNFSYLLLRQGRFDEGWECLEVRDWYAKLAAYLDFPRWRGEPLVGRSVLIGIEAGMGDMIQFSRYARDLKERGAACVGVICHPPLKRLFASCTDIDDVLGLDDPLRPPSASMAWDYWVPPLSLPFLFGTRLETIPARLPYVFAEIDKIEQWSETLGARRQGDGRALKVGLVWRGNPRFENDADRSLPCLDTLAPLWRVEGVRFFSLQKGVGEDEARQPPAGLSIIDLAPQIGDFSDTAAIIANLDLVISVDTAVAHLAGAMGRPCWILLPDFKTDWRWLDGRSDTPWYPNVVRLFRQHTMGDWAEVVERMAEALKRERDA